ncbi:MAG TPA: DUF5996 family protein [Allosphingosinicella sp.]|nr:DUF5996 family protein [Allosphingosinicella sp.]
MSGTSGDWPELSSAGDRPTIVMLHLVSQIVGKVATALLPWRNHGWHLTLRVTPRGLRTEVLYGAGAPFELLIDLVDHEVRLIDGAGSPSVPLRPMSVADFHAEFTDMMARNGRRVGIHSAPNEVDPATRFADDREPRGYDRDSAGRLLAALLAADRVFKQFRSAFLGKVSPVHFFWGSFDLAVTRFSGRAAPLHPGGIPNLPDAVTREAYSHEVSSAGFWPGGAGAEGEPFFYSYAYPTAEGFGDRKVAPGEARFDEALGEFVLDYAAVRGAADPDRVLLDFLESTYRAAADLGEWDRSIECAPGQPGVPRAV